MYRTLSTLLVAAATVAAALAPQGAQGGFPDLGKRLPADTNTIIAVNLESVMKTPLGKEMNWADKWADAYEAGPTPFPMGTIRAVVGAYYVPASKDSQWKIAMMDMSQEIDLPAIARAEGGYPDRMWDKDGVVSPAGAFYIAVQPNVLAGMEPADRPFALKWIRESGNFTGPTSPFLGGLVKTLGARTQIIMGMDMANMFSAPDVRRTLAVAPFESMGEKADLDLWSNFLASLQSMRFDVAITDKITGRLSVEFGMGAQLLKTNGKALLTEIVGRAGMDLPDLDQWNVSVEDKTFKAEGPLTPQSLRQIIGIIGMPAPAMTTDQTIAEATEDPAVIAKASSKYFRSISNSIDQMGSNNSYERAKTWVMREAQRIERLPILNVDPELVAWGGEVASRLRQVGGSLAYDQQNTTAKTMNVQSAGSYNFSYNGGNGYWGSGGYGANYSSAYQGRGTTANLEWQRQRAQIYQQGKADSIKQAKQIWGKIGADRDKMRAKMVAKYKVEF